MIKNSVLGLCLILCGCATTERIVKVPEIKIEEKVIYCEIDPMFLQHQKFNLDEDGTYTYLEVEKELVKIIKSYQNNIEFIKLSKCVKK